MIHRLVQDIENSCHIFAIGAAVGAAAFGILLLIVFTFVAIALAGALMSSIASKVLKGKFKEVDQKFSDSVKTGFDFIWRGTLLFLMYLPIFGSLFVIVSVIFSELFP